MIVNNGSSQETRVNRIFGPVYQNVKISGSALKGAVYYLKSGHGGPDPGAMVKYQKRMLCEDEYAYDVILRLGRKLIENGATVYFIIRDPNDGIRDREFLTPDKDEVCYPDLTIPLNQVERLKQRVNAINSLYNQNKGSFQRMVAIHVDSRSKGKNIDVFFYHDKVSKKGEKAAKILKNTFVEKYRKNQPDRGYNGSVSARNLYVLTHSKPVSVFIELGNIHHSLDQKRIIDANNRQALANWLAEGLIKDFRTNK
jgi:N-acetylmuramoyl-L-alanine amidase